MKLVSYLHITIVLSLLALISSCTDEDIVQKTQYDVVEGVPVKIALNFNVEKSRISTRSASSSTLENTVNSLYIIAFHGQDVWARDFRDNVNGINNGAIDQLDIKSGTGIQLYAIANVNSGVGNLNKDALDAVTTYNEFLNLTTKLVDPLSTERMGFLMLGQLKATDGTSNIAIDRDGSILSGNTKIELQRLDARISFFVKAENSTYQDMKFEPKYYTVEQIPQASYLVPHDVDYDDDFASMEAAQARNYFDTDSEFEGTDEDYNGQYDFFEFYLLENRKETANPIKEGDNTKYETESLYALREKRKVSETEKPDGSKPGQEYVAGDFLFAPENSTYVKIYGTLTYTAMEEGIQKFYNANVCYTVHLGSTGSDANDVDLVNNYDTERNVWYRYYVTITGLNSLKVEVKDDKEERPGAEGDVIVGGGEVKDIDAHYGRQKFSLTREAVKSGLSWAVSTPFQSGLKAFNRENFLNTDGNVITDETQLADVEGLQTDLTLNDYKWVQFAINAECVDDNASHVYVKYPGYSAYSGGSGNNNPAPAFGGNGIQSSYYNKTVKLYDVNQLLNHLYVEANKTNSQIFLDDSGSASSEDNATVTITAYIDEYIYKYKPTEVFYEEPDAVQEGDPDLLLWKDVVNGENRMLHICESGAEYSPDGNSSWAESVITFSQRPVYTFYDPTSDVKTAWGTESLMETAEALPIGSYNRTSSTYYPNTADNGRENQLNFLKSGSEIGSLAWTDVLSLDEDEYGKLQDKYNSIWYACIGRNRDLNGNNVIDANEIRWYLASVDQLTDLWIGEEAVPNAKLYPLDPQGTELVPYVHVASSTYFGNSPNSPWVIWAEEGASRGQYYAGGDDKNEYGQTASRNRYYRCVRNLGLSLGNISDTPADYVIPTENKKRTVGTGSRQTTYTEHWIDVTRLERNTRRSILVGQPLPNNDVTERSRNNRPYDKFAVLVEENSEQAIYPEAPEYDRRGNEIDTENGIWSSYYIGESNGSPCPTGYRIPNQRELMLMYTTFPDLFSSTSENWMYMAKTGFGWKNHVGYGDHRAGFAYDRGNLRLIDNANQSVKVRCVRDVEPGEQ